MNLLLTHIHPRPGAALPFEAEVGKYLKLASKWVPAETRGFASEELLGAFVDAQKQRPTVVLCDMRGKALSSEGFAEWVGKKRDGGAALMVLGIGPADGWSAGMLERADLRLAFGSMTLPHALARLVLAEQVFRAVSILHGHPYHLGH